MARLKKEEKKVFDPSLLIQNQKWKSDTIKELMISEGKGGSPNTPTPGWDKGWPPPAPLKNPKLANFLAPSGTGKTLSEEAYWDGLQTIMETTEAGSNEQNKRLNILMHQFQDQVSKPTDGLKIAQNFSPADVPLGDGMIYEAKTKMQQNLKQKYDMMLENGMMSEQEYHKQMKRLTGTKK